MGSDLDAGALAAWTILLLGLPVLATAAFIAPERSLTARLARRLAHLQDPWRPPPDPSLDRLAVESRYRMASIASACALGAVAVAFASIAWAAGAGEWASVVIALAVVGMVQAVKTLRRRRQLYAIRVQWPEAVDQMARALRAGHALPAALLMVAQESAEPLSSEFEHLHKQMQIGVGWDDALGQLAQRIPLPEVRFLSMAVILQRSTGGQLAEVLTTLAELVRERLRLVDKMRVLSAEGRLSTWVLGSAVATFALAWHTLHGAMRARERTQKLHRRLRAHAPAGAGDTPATTLRRWPTWLRRLREPLATLAHPQEDQEASHLRMALWQAGWSSPTAFTTFLAWRVALTLGLPLAAWAVMQVVPVPGWMTRQAYAVLTASAVLGYGLPRWVLAYRRRQRQQQMITFLPDAVDLLVVCMEAGLGLDMALQRTATQMQLQCPELARELEGVTTQLRVGASRAHALRQLAQRTGLSDVGWLVSAMLQSDRYGTPLAQGLRVHAKDFRLRRQRRAEEAAARLPVQLLFPLLLTLFPALFVVLVGPAAIGLMRSLGPLLGSA